ncbi:hypothetical protein FB565_001869 [Actinoplanes lutulentus]|uniref:Tyrosine specific protein phosphatases domain-containing protein n=1 Tax=Actinoplanes lutulentus TaxID=1287878 RepID=A0A327Z0B3_9ACTN|nr:hypothetical protein [Actinoplanes lutulentus]MBB2942156.1 hypothetical protein [Actinoplanes lutulentus]RAK26890.1 hypothetical protein B0I29_12544 [Actinoplanes lutulentus]
MAPALHVIAGPGPGQLATIAHSPQEPWSALELGALARSGVQTLVFTGMGAEGDTAGIELVSFPDAADPVKREEATEVVALAARLAQDVRSGRFVVTQSTGGVGRSTLLSTMTLTLLGIRPAEALRRIGPRASSEVPRNWLHDFVSTHG